MKIIILIILIIIGFDLSACSVFGINQNNNSSSPVETNDTDDRYNIDKTDNKDNTFVMKIDDVIVDITWEDNNSVTELMAHAKNGLSITMRRYGGFEQVGSIGKTITSNDTQITTSPGDVVLYSSNQIVIFFGTNSWSYTKLGHINLSQSELNSLLNKSNVTLKLGEELNE